MKVSLFDALLWLNTPKRDRRRLLRNFPTRARQVQERADAIAWKYVAVCWAVVAACLVLVLFG